MICCNNLCCAPLSSNQTHSVLNWSPLRSSLKSWNLISPSEASLKLSRVPFRDSELLPKSFKSSLSALKADFYRFLWLFNIFRRPSLNPSCILRLEFVNQCFFLCISIALIWLLLRLVGHFSTLISAFPSSLRWRYWSTDMQARQSSYIFSVTWCYTSGRHKAFTDKLWNFCCKIRR